MEKMDMNEENTDHEQETGKAGPVKWGIVLVWVAIIGLLIVLGLQMIKNKKGPVSVGERAPDFVLTTFGGEQINNLDLAGKVIVINFWASWCKPCEQEAVELEQAHQYFKDQDVVFLGIAYADTETQALDYLSKFGVTYPNGPDLGTRITQAFRTRGVPETYIVGKDGKLADVMIGPYMSLAEIIKDVENALME